MCSDNFASLKIISCLTRLWESVVAIEIEKKKCNRVRFICEVKINDSQLPRYNGVCPPAEPRRCPSKSCSILEGKGSFTNKRSYT